MLAHWFHTIKISALLHQPSYPISFDAATSGGYLNILSWSIEN